MRVCLVAILSLTCLLLSCDRKPVEDLPDGVIMGDINCNGTAYDYGDVIMFARFFVAGDTIFGDHIVESAAASDLNQDGVKLDVTDFVYLMKATFCDPLPFSMPAPVKARYVRKWGRFSVDRPMAAVLLVIEGVNYVVEGLDDVVVLTGIVNGNTHVLVCGFEDYNWTCNDFSGPFVRVEGKILRDEWVTPEGQRAYADLVERLDTFAVYQNYPNPFASVTKIGIINPNNGPWKMTIYSSAGKRVAKFEGESGGAFSIYWDASGLPSGIYFYKVEADGKSITKKATLLRGD